MLGPGRDWGSKGGGIATFQAHSKAQLVNYFVRGRQNVNAVFKAIGEE
jgi:hypothetical protein